MTVSASRARAGPEAVAERSFRNARPRWVSTVFSVTNSVRAISRFSPRPAGLPDQRFWRLDRHADYGPLDRLARHRTNPDLIIEQWEDILPSRARSRPGPCARPSCYASSRAPADPPASAVLSASSAGSPRRCAC